MSDSQKFIHEKSAVKIYKLRLPSYYHNIPKFKGYLTTAELEKAERYHFKKDKDRFIICRASLRLLLSELIGLNPMDIIIARDKNKKPYLPSHPKVFFNVSHTIEYGLIAISSNPVGIDVENVNREWDYSETAPQIFGGTELEKLALTKDKVRLFFTYWTRKEAIVKATGKGIEDNFIHIPACDGMHLIKPKLINNITNLLVLSFDLEEHYVGSIALVGKIEDIKQLYFSPLPYFK
jgi:4'-phosphopantetheinyl transferase